MSRRLIATYGADRAAPLMVAKVYRDTDTEGFLVRFYKDGTKLRPQADYETDSRADALQTAALSVEMAHTARGQQ